MSGCFPSDHITLVIIPASETQYENTKTLMGLSDASLKRYYLTQ